MKSILEQLAAFEGPRSKVVDFTLSNDKRVMLVRECAESFYEAELNKAEFGKMIAELKALHAQMEA